MKLALGVATGTTTSPISFATALFRQAFVTKDTFFPSLAVGNEAVKVPLALTQHIWTILCMNRLFPPDSLNTSDPLEIPDHRVNGCTYIAGYVDYLTLRKCTVDG